MKQKFDTLVFHGVRDRGFEKKGTIIKENVSRGFYLPSGAWCKYAPADGECSIANFMVFRPYRKKKFVVIAMEDIKEIKRRDE